MEKVYECPECEDPVLLSILTGKTMKHRRDMTQKCIIHFNDGSTTVFEGEAQFPVGDKRRVVKVQFTKPQEKGKEVEEKGNGEFKPF